MPSWIALTPRITLTSAQRSSLISVGPDGSAYHITSHGSRWA
jgi:hypothetical protein